MRKLFLAFALLCAPISLWAQGGVPASPIVILDSLGRPRAGVTVTICTSGGTGSPCTPLASIFTDAGLTNPATNPMLTDGLGNLPVIYAAPGTYKYTVTGTGITPSGPFTATVAGTGGGNVLSGSPNTFTEANAFTGNVTATGGQNQVTAYNFQGLFQVDGNKYPSCQGAITALPSSNPIGGTITLGGRSANPCKLWVRRDGQMMDGASTLSGLTVGQFAHIWNLSSYDKQDDLDSNNGGYTTAPGIWMFGSDSLGTGNSSEFRLHSPNHGALTLDNMSGTSRQIDPTTGCTGNGATTTCTVLSTGPNITWVATNVVCVFGTASVLDACQTLTAATATTFSFASSFNGTKTGNGLNANLSTNSATNRAGIVWRKEDEAWGLWELGIGLQNPSGAEAFSLQNYSQNPGGSSYFLVDPITGTLTLNSNTGDQTKSFEVWRRAGQFTGANVAIIHGPAAKLILADSGANGAILEYDAPEGTPIAFANTDSSNNFNIGANASGKVTNITSGTGTKAATFDASQNFLPGAAGTLNQGSASLPWKSLFLGTAATNNFNLLPAATSAARTVSIPDPGTNVNLAFDLTATSSAFATATTAGTCVQNTTAVTGAATTMAVVASPVSTPGVGAVWSAFVSSAGNVTINECAVATSAGGTIAFNIRVIP